MHIQPQAHRIALDLDVAFLQDVEQSHLDLAGQVGQLVDGEDAAVCPRQQAVVHRQVVAKLQPAARSLDRIDVAEHVGDRHVRSSQLLDVALLARAPGDRQVVALGGGTCAALRADRGQRVVVNLAARHNGDRRVQQIDEAAQDARLCLPAQSEQDEIVLREQPVDELRHDGVVVANDAWEERFARLQFGDQVRADLVFDGRISGQTPFNGRAQGAHRERLFTGDHRRF